MNVSEIQPELISSDPPLCETRLVADSVRRAYYVVSIRKIQVGYIIRKESGAERAKPQTELYWRPVLKLAMEKYRLLLAAKLRKQKGRIYKITQEVSSHE